MPLEDRLHDRENNFDVLRLVAASLVLFSHCYPLTGRPEPFARLSGWTLGELGVVMFFAMSGFLIAKSWSDQPEPAPFAVKRGLRLLPALAVAVALTTLVVGPLFTVLPLRDYVGDPETWTYLVRTSLLITIAGRLPGVFLDNPYPEAINGSLWTLPVEAGCYVLAAALGLLGCLRRSSLLTAGAALLLLGISPLSPLPAGLRDTTAGGRIAVVAPLGAAFVLGALLFSLRGRLRLSWWPPAALAGVWVVTWGGGWVVPAGVVTASLAVLVLAFRTPAALRRITAPGDVSYGMYVYAFPVQQSIAALWGAVDPLVMLGIAFPVTYGLALLSWRLVERPALGLKERLGRRRVQAADLAER